MNVLESRTYASDRGYTTWTDETDDSLAKHLLLAQDYIDFNYNLKDEFSEAEQEKADVAQFTIALDILRNGEPTTRKERVATQESKELAGLKISKTYADTNADPYPSVTKLLAPLARTSGQGSVSFGRLVR
ncbi:hypothetical protein PF049_00175 [Erythrobacteraceae bacterium WH01K]|nr:hypothetical protein PF049_00175 [Erythrobacteraceae bacterium WH01K]